MSSNSGATPDRPAFPVMNNQEAADEVVQVWDASSPAAGHGMWSLPCCAACPCIARRECAACLPAPLPKHCYAADVMSGLPMLRQPDAPGGQACRRQAQHRQQSSAQSSAG